MIGWQICTIATTLSEHAFAEQKQGNLPWHHKMLKVIECWQGDPNIKPGTGSKIKKNMLLSFNVLWKNCCKNNTKLRFYNIIKPELGPETYLGLTQEGTIRIGKTPNPHSYVLPLT